MRLERPPLALLHEQALEHGLDIRGLAQHGGGPEFDSRRPDYNKQMVNGHLHAPMYPERPRGDILGTF